MKQLNNQAMSNFLFFSGSSNLPLAQKVADDLGIKLAKTEIDHFPNRETRVRIDENVKDKTCFFLQSLSTPTDENWVETLFFLDALKRGGAKKIIGVLPWLGYQKQDKVFRYGEAVSVSVVVKTLETMGMDKIITIDLHSPQIVNYFQNKPVILSAFPLFLNVISSEVERSRPKAARVSLDFSTPRRIGGSVEMTDCVIVAPDAGAYWAKDFAQKLNLDLVQLKKTRDRKTAIITLAGFNPVLDDINGKIALIVDDVIYTGATLILAAKLLKQHGAKKVFCFATHAMWDEKSAKDLQSSEIDSLIVADTILISEKKLFPKLKIISVSDVISDIMFSCNFQDQLPN